MFNLVTAAQAGPAGSTEYLGRGAIVGRCQGRCLLVGVPTTPLARGRSGGGEWRPECGPCDGMLSSCGGPNVGLVGAC